MTFQQEPPPPDAKIVLGRASAWIGRVGAGLVIVGAVLAVCAATLSAAWPMIKMILAMLLWIVPGVVYLLTARGLQHRKRWAITSAEATTYTQMALAGIIILIALLSIKTLWPLILIAGLWLAVLLRTPAKLKGLSQAMDILAARVTDR